jgi:peptide alpha-N-acetyltransferase
MSSTTSSEPTEPSLLPSLDALTLSSPSTGSSSVPADLSSLSAPSPPLPTAVATPPVRLRVDEEITYRAYQGEEDLDVIVELVDDELSEPYNLYTYRYFLDEWYVSFHSVLQST